MAETESLTLAYLGAHPADAARVLEALAPGEAAALFERVPARIGAPALAAMLPTAAARALEAIRDDAALGLLVAAGTQAAVGILRHVPEARRVSLIERLPTTAAIASRLLLGYPEDSVGAWADPDLIALDANTSVRDALQRVRNAAADVEEVHIVDADKQPVGIVAVAALLHAGETLALAALMRKPTGLLPAVMPVRAAAAHPGWQQSAIMPVVGRANRMIGVLRRAALSRALARGRAAVPDHEAETVIGLLASSYWNAVSGLIEAALAVLPAAGRGRSER